MIISTRIQHHPSRADLLPTLLAGLDGLGPLVVADPDPQSRKPSSWRTHRACIDAIPDDATHLLVVQDDAILCADFAARAVEIVAERPERVVSFFVPGLSHFVRQVAVARKRRQRWFDFVGLIPLVAVCYPVDVARQIPEYADRRRMGVNRADDGVVATFAKAHRIMACAPLPNLVDHPPGLPSAMGMPLTPAAAHRRSVWFVDEST